MYGTSNKRNSLDDPGMGVLDGRKNPETLSISGLKRVQESQQNVLFSRLMCC